MLDNQYNVKILALAETDIESIYEYYFQEAKEQEIAKKLIFDLKNAILGLGFMPNSHPQIREQRLHKKGFRKLICGEFIIPFFIDEKSKTVLVVRVFHGKRNYQKYL